VAEAVVVQTLLTTAAALGGVALTLWGTARSDGRRIAADERREARAQAAEDATRRRDAYLRLLAYANEGKRFVGTSTSEERGLGLMREGDIAVISVLALGSAEARAAAEAVSRALTTLSQARQLATSSAKEADSVEVSLEHYEGEPRTLTEADHEVLADYQAAREEAEGAFLDADKKFDLAWLKLLEVVRDEIRSS